LIAGIVIASVAYFIVPLLIKFFFQNYYNNETLYIFSLLLFILPLRIMASYVGGAHTGPTGNAHFSLWPMVIAGISNVILDIIFIDKFGFIGVVYSTLMCYSFAIITFSAFYYRKLRQLTNEKT
jgi:O-antigen/teichoic acid export membrane protein